MGNSVGSRGQMLLGWNTFCPVNLHLADVKNIEAKWKVVLKMKLCLSLEEFLLLFSSSCLDAGANGKEYLKFLWDIFQQQNENSNVINALSVLTCYYMLCIGEEKDKVLSILSLFDFEKCHSLTKDAIFALTTTTFQSMVPFLKADFKSLKLYDHKVIQNRVQSIVTRAMGQNKINSITIIDAAEFFSDLINLKSDQLDYSINNVFDSIFPNCLQQEHKEQLRSDQIELDQKNRQCSIENSSDTISSHNYESSAGTALRPRTTSNVASLDPVWVAGYATNSFKNRICTSQSRVVWSSGSLIINAELCGNHGYKMVHGHGGKITCLCVSPCGNYIASCEIYAEQQFEIVTWNLETSTIS